MQLTEDQIFALAPDEASKKAGKDLSNPAKWVSKGINKHAIWGECQGSGSKPYQTQVDISTLTFKCSCPSRKFPCKHGLGLLLFHTKNTNSFTDDVSPQWVADWLDKRTEKAEKKAEQADKPVNAIAQEKRLQAREELIENGMNDLLLWMKDILRNGIIHIPEQGTAIFDNLAKRMIDAKAPGLASMMKGLGNFNYYKEGWQTIFMQQLSAIYLVITGFKNKEHVNPLLLEDIKNQIGFTQNQEVLKQQQGIEDIWFVLGKQITDDEKITTERNWLYGTKSKQYALVLQFSVRGQGITFSLTAGKYIKAELVFFPSIVPLRAVIKNQVSVEVQSTMEGYTNWQDIAVTETNFCAAVPVLDVRPYIVHSVVPVFFNDQWWLSDNTNHLVQLPENFSRLYYLLSVSGGMAMNMTVIGKENMYEPIGVWTNQEYLII